MSRRNARILVVEDNDTLRNGIALALRESWSDVDEIATGTAAVEQLQDPTVEPYDVVLSDLRLPGADGIELSQQQYVVARQQCASRDKAIGEGALAWREPISHRGHAERVGDDQSAQLPPCGEAEREVDE